jgi:dTDP-4-dehydrorhamnose reductase
MALFKSGKPVIWLIGNKGMLGTELSLLFESQGLAYISTGRELDITNGEALLKFAQQQRKSIGWIINCAAYTEVDKAEDDRERCRLVNTEGAGNVACAAKKTGARLVHFSTDYVFGGGKNGPYTENDPVEPISVYGLTKRDGETRVLEENEQSYVIRTSWLYGKHGNNFVHTMLRLMKARDSISVVNDQRGSPTWTWDLAGGVLALIKRIDEGNTISNGIYHFANSGETTRFDFARKIGAFGRASGVLAKDCKIFPCAGDEFPAKAKRPANSALDNTKMRKALRMAIPAWDESLKKFLGKVDKL